MGAADGASEMKNSQQIAAFK